MRNREWMNELGKRAKANRRGGGKEKVGLKYKLTNMNHAHARHSYRRAQEKVAPRPLAVLVDNKAGRVG